jgi:hypothetical protein
MRGTVRHTDRWPRPDAEIPVTFDRTDPHNFRIEWDELPTYEELSRRRELERERQIMARYSDTGRPKR